MFGTKRDRFRIMLSFMRNHQEKRLLKYIECVMFFISPSREEVCQLPSMEAMVSGCALVATNVGGVPDYTISGETAFVCPPGEIEEFAKNIELLIENPEFFRKIASKGRRYRENFSWDKVSAELERVLRL